MESQGLYEQFDVSEFAGHMHYTGDGFCKLQRKSLGLFTQAAAFSRNTIDMNQYTQTEEPIEEKKCFVSLPTDHTKDIEKPLAVLFANDVILKST